jgi:hypothetical protein
MLPYSAFCVWSWLMNSRARSSDITLTRLTLFWCVTPYILSATFTSSGRNVVVINWVFAMSARRRIISMEVKDLQRNNSIKGNLDVTQNITTMNKFLASQVHITVINY